MNTYEGESVYPSGGAPSLFSIGVGLGRMPRFAGQTKEWYPVLCHVLVVASLVPEQHSIHGLLHDAQESCLADVPTTWKTVAARRREDVLLRRIYARHLHGVNFPLSDEIQSAVDLADHTALAAEANVLGHSRAKENWPEFDELAGELTLAMLAHCRDYLDPEIAGATYVDAFNIYAPSPSFNNN